MPTATTRLIRGSNNITPEVRGGVITIGNFDGVHLGHQMLMRRVVELAKEQGVPSIAITFEPHPFEFFANDNITIPRITRLREKFTALADCGIEIVIILEFNQSLADLSASKFMSLILLEKLHPKHIVVGDDFHFGKQRQGDFSLLESMGKAAHVTVEAMSTTLFDGERVSSTRVRKALSAGNLILAKQLLGRPYTMHGRVAHGKKLGRELGFPTANIFLHRRLTPLKGIYTVYLHGIGDKPLPGVANLGERPTIDGTETLLEVHLLDFNQDIYGRYVKVEFCKKLRDEERYPNLDILKEHIANDVAISRTYFKEQGML